MVAPDWAPATGDLVWLTLDPQAGHEQAGRRPALVLSPERYNRITGLALICPVTSRVKGYPFEVALPAGLSIAGVVLADQVKSLDWRVRQATAAGRVPGPMLRAVLDRILPLLGVGRAPAGGQSG